MCSAIAFDNYDAAAHELALRDPDAKFARVGHSHEFAFEDDDEKSNAVADDDEDVDGVPFFFAADEAARSGIRPPRRFKFGHLGSVPAKFYRTRGRLHSDGKPCWWERRKRAGVREGRVWRVFFSFVFPAY